MHTLLHHLISTRAGLSPGSDALFYKHRAIKYKTLAELVSSLAHGLIKASVDFQDRVAIYLPKRIENVVAMFACSAAGAVFVPVNPILKSVQVRYILNDCNVRLLVTSSDRFQQIKDSLCDCSDLHTVVLIDEPKEKPESPGKNIRIYSWQDVLKDNTIFPQIKTIDTDIVSILYTSGSTGNPKGVVLSHKNMLTGAQSVAQYLENSQNDRLLAVLPFSFDYGLSQLTTAFYTGASVVLMDYLFPRDVIKAVDKYQITGLAAVPPLWIQLAQLKWPESCSLRYFTNSGGVMPVEILDKLRLSLPDASPFLMYGLTEAFRSTYVPPEKIDTHKDSIGIAIPNAEVLVLREDGSECEDNEHGELVHRGSLVSLGYWNAAEKTAERFRPRKTLDGCVLPEMVVWSGDTVRRAKDGYLYFVSRKDDMIKTSGYRVSPNEVEDVAYKFKQLREVVALGITHPVLGQAIVLIINPQNELFERESFINHCKNNLPNYMLPAEIIISKEIPRNQNGKVDRKQLAEKYQELFKNVEL